MNLLSIFISVYIALELELNWSNHLSMLHVVAHRVPLGDGDEQDPYEGASSQGCKSVRLHGAVLTVLLLQLLYHQAILCVIYGGA